MLTGVLVCLAVVIALLAIPVVLQFHVSWPEGTQRQIQLRWGFGLVRIDLTASRPSPESGPAEREADGGHRLKPKAGKWNFMALVKHKGFRRRILRFMGDLWRAVHTEDVDVHVRIGLDDPADTGQLWAFIGPVAGLLANCRETRVRIEPDFVDETVEMNGSGNIRIVPLYVLYLAAALAISPSVWAGMRQARAGG